MNFEKIYEVYMSDDFGCIATVMLLIFFVAATLHWLRN